jgi:hypothetical protein
LQQMCVFYVEYLKKSGSTWWPRTNAAIKDYSCIMEQNRLSQWS